MALFTQLWLPARHRETGRKLYPPAVQQRGADQSPWASTPRWMTKRGAGQNFIRITGKIFYLQKGNKASSVTVFASVTPALGTRTGASNDQVSHH